jgi:transcriptional regulator with XRE-family HTH domain
MPFESNELNPDKSIRHLYGDDLRRHRKRAKLSLVKLADLVPSSKSQLARIEAGEQMAPPGLSEHFDRVFGTDGHFTRLYVHVRREIHPDQYRRFMDFEEDAKTIEGFAGHTVPGLLQTEAYARELLRCQPITEEKVEERVAARIGRQDRLKGSNPPHIWSILDEGALRREIGGPQVMADQLANLLPLVDTPTTKIQVLPYSHGAHPFLGGSMTLLKLSDGREVAYEEGIDANRLYEDPSQVEQRKRVYDELRANALSLRESATLISKLMEEYKSSCEPPNT